MIRQQHDPEKLQTFRDKIMRQIKENQKSVDSLYQSDRAKFAAALSQLTVFHHAARYSARLF